MQATTPARGPSEQELIEAFEKADGLNARIGVLRKLARVGKERSVPLLAKLLDDEDPVIREYAREALTANPSAQAGKALIDALGRAKDPASKVAIIDALGEQRQAAAVGPLAALVADADADVSAAAIAALGNIGTPAAQSVLVAEIHPLKKKLADIKSMPEQEAADVRRMTAQVLRALVHLLWEYKGYRPGPYRGAGSAWQPTYSPFPGSPGWTDLPAEIQHPLMLAVYRGMVNVGDNGKVFVPLVQGYLQNDKASVLEQAEAARLLIDFTDENRVFPQHIGPIDVRQKVLELLPKMPHSAQGFVLEALAERDRVRRAAKEQGPDAALPASK